jgi:hypothetical protein
LSLWFSPPTELLIVSGSSFGFISQCESYLVNSVMVLCQVACSKNNILIDMTTADINSDCITFRKFLQEQCNSKVRKKNSASSLNYYGRYELALGGFVGVIWGWSCTCALSCYQHLCLTRTDPLYVTQVLCDFTCNCPGSRDSVVGIATDHRLDDREVGFRVPVE